mmetsp:Transcript_7453/g.15610  ORF Transcript_7453/g.15610 Transcript_7453/m.15610 type:complete len:312 (-) Transcript_7453:473-1408(-)
MDSVVELRQGDAKGLERVQRTLEVKVEAVIVDLAELADHVCDVPRVNELEVLDRGHSDAPVEVEAVVTVLKDWLLALELPAALLKLIRLELPEQTRVRIVELVLLRDGERVLVRRREHHLELARLRAVAHMIHDGRLGEEHRADLILDLFVIVHDVLNLGTRALELTHVVAALFAQPPTHVAARDVVDVVRAAVLVRLLARNQDQLLAPLLTPALQIEVVLGIQPFEARAVAHDKALHHRVVGAALRHGLVVSLVRLLALVGGAVLRRVGGDRRVGRRRHLAVDVVLVHFQRTAVVALLHLLALVCSAVVR